MKAALTIGVAGLALFAFFGGLLHATKTAEARCVSSNISTIGYSAALFRAARERRSLRRANRRWSRAAETAYGSAFSNRGYARYSYKFCDGDGSPCQVYGVPCDANR